MPNWLREELLKKKSTSVSASVQHSTEFHSKGSEDAEKILKSSDQADSRSVDSVKSTDDDEEDEVQFAILLLKTTYMTSFWSQDNSLIC